MGSPVLPRGTPIENSFVSMRGTYASIGDSLWLVHGRLPIFERVRQFEGATRGLRLIHETSSGILFVAPEGALLADEEKGLWRSADSGAKWERVISLAGIPNPTSVWAFAESSCGALFAGTYVTAPVVRCAEILRSRDGGARWEVVYRDGTGRHVHAIAVDGSGAIYASIGDDFAPWRTRRVIRSINGGAEWSEILSDLPQIGPIVALPGARLFASDCPGGARIFRSSDDVSCETVLHDPDPLYFFWMRHDRSSNAVLASAVRGGQNATEARIYRSIDGGRSWQVLLRSEARAKSDGSIHASNVGDSKLLVHFRRDGKPQDTLVCDMTGPSNSDRVRRERLRSAAERVVAGALLVASSPVLAISALLIKATSAGPALFVQERRGLHGRPFLMPKLRTMRVDSKDSAVSARVTSVGRVLRRLSVDELPQLWCVVKGEMVMVGPRPHPIALDDRFAASLPSFRRRYEVPPGMTGLAQVSGARGAIRSKADMSRRLQLDLEYIRNRNLRLDVEILMRTLLGGFVDRS